MLRECLIVNLLLDSPLHRNVDASGCVPVGAQWRHAWTPIGRALPACAPRA